MNNVVNTLQQKGIKATTQRVIIYNLIKDLKNHPTAEMVYQITQKKYPTISLATVYKTLEHFSEKGLIHKISTADGKLRYDPRINEHHHIICTNTNEIIDIEENELSALINNYLKSLTIDNFEINDVKILIKGKKINLDKSIKINV